MFRNAGVVGLYGCPGASNCQFWDSLVLARYIDHGYKLRGKTYRYIVFAFHVHRVLNTVLRTAGVK